MPLHRPVSLCWWHLPHPPPPHPTLPCLSSSRESNPRGKKKASALAAAHRHLDLSLCPLLFYESVIAALLAASAQRITIASRIYLVSDFCAVQVPGFHVASHRSKHQGSRTRTESTSLGLSKPFNITLCWEVRRRRRPASYARHLRTGSGVLVQALQRRWVSAIGLRLMGLRLANATLMLRSGLRERDLIQTFIGRRRTYLVR